jgi:hypothetical protein
MIDFTGSASLLGLDSEGRARLWEALVSAIHRTQRLSRTGRYRLSSMPNR